MAEKKKAGAPRQYSEPLKAVIKNVPESKIPEFHVMTNKWIDKFKLKNKK